MGITDPTRKKLWSRSGNKCAMCKTQLISDNEDVIGQECHIKGKEPGSERHDSTLSKQEVDSYGNLILLCPNHHVLIDKKGNGMVYTVEFLLELKEQHEEEVRFREVFLFKDQLKESDLVRVYNKLSFGTYYELFKESIEEFFDLTTSEQNMMFYLFGRYDLGKFNIPKISKKGGDNLIIIKALLDNNFLSFREEISLYVETGFGLDDLNSNMDVITQKAYEHNWDLGKHGKIVLKCFKDFGRPTDLSSFKKKFKN
ncbi:HNH endonuclease [Lysinibacillus sp. NPDC097279]|uniref:HNH endonuclease n=1 Tax=Lysinibacillus sp. NPDC097279 TaxID=3364143 RepID=UPI00382793BC